MHNQALVPAAAVAVPPPGGAQGGDIAPIHGPALASLMDNSTTPLVSTSLGEYTLLQYEKVLLENYPVLFLYVTKKRPMTKMEMEFIFYGNHKPFNVDFGAWNEWLERTFDFNFYATPLPVIKFIKLEGEVLTRYLLEQQTLSEIAGGPLMGGGASALTPSGTLREPKYGSTAENSRLNDLVNDKNMSNDRPGILPKRGGGNDNTPSKLPTKNDIAVVFEGTGLQELELSDKLPTKKDIAVVFEGTGLKELDSCDTWPTKDNIAVVLQGTGQIQLEPLQNFQSKVIHEISDFTSKTLVNGSFPPVLDSPEIGGNVVYNSGGTQPGVKPILVIENPDLEKLAPLQIGDVLSPTMQIRIGQKCIPNLYNLTTMQIGNELFSIVQNSFDQELTGKVNMIRQTNQNNIIAKSVSYQNNKRKVFSSTRISTSQDLIDQVIDSVLQDYRKRKKISIWSN